MTHFWRTLITLTILVSAGIVAIDSLAFYAISRALDQ